MADYATVTKIHCLAVQMKSSWNLYYMQFSMDRSKWWRGNEKIAPLKKKIATVVKSSGINRQKITVEEGNIAKKE